MADLISRDICEASLLETYEGLKLTRIDLRDSVELVLVETKLNTLAKAIKIVKAQPGIDLVHCRDCQHWHNSGWCKLIGQEFDRWPGYFCADGVRKEGVSNG